MQMSVNFVQNVLLVDALMRQEKLPSLVMDFLNIYNVVRPKHDTEFGTYSDNHYLMIRNSKEPQSRLVLENLSKDLYLNEFVWGDW